MLKLLLITKVISDQVIIIIKIGITPFADIIDLEKTDYADKSDLRKV